MAGGRTTTGRRGYSSRILLPVDQAAARETAIGKVFTDLAENRSGFSNIFGFIDNFLLGYVPYTVWSILTKEKSDLKSTKKFGFFAAATFLTRALFCSRRVWVMVAGLRAGFADRGYDHVTNELSVVAVNSILLALTDIYVCKSGWLYVGSMKRHQTRSKLNLERKKWPCWRAIFFLYPV